MPSAWATRVRADPNWPRQPTIEWQRKHLTNLPPEATREEMSAARLPLAYRDSCAHLLIPLNRCRHEEYYLPWKCEVHGPRALPYTLRRG